MNYRKNPIFKMTDFLSRLLFVVSISLPAAVLALPVDLANVPLTDTPLTDIKPNMLYVMDDSGSMGRDYMPDWANDNGAFFEDSSYNSIAYNPAVRYMPPVNFTAAGKDTASYPSQTGANTATGANWQTKPNWRAVKFNPFLSNGTTNLENLNGGAGPEYWVTVPDEYCTRKDLRDCAAQTVPSATHPYAAPIRWCNSGANAAAATPPVGACQAVRINSGSNQFNNLRAPAAAGAAGVPVATITFTSASSTPRVNSIRVGGQEILRRRTAQTNNLSSLASGARDRINNCTNGAWGNCSVGGFSATASGNVLTIYAPYATTATPVVQFNRGSGATTNTAFNTPAPTPGGRRQTFIDPATTSYPYPGQTTKAAERTDCAGTTCTYAEEMTNYANWYSYYRERILMMKTATSLAFETVDSDFRLGYMTIHPGSNQRINIDTFNGAHKAAWYSRLFATTDGGATPLREALSDAGRIFANKEIVGGTFTDPIEYECQQNFTLLTTDGFWNSGDGKELNGSTTMRNYDASPALAPYYEGATATSNTLADVAKYYRDTDLRTTALGNCTGALGADVCETPSSGAGIAPNQKQTMVTLTLGLGVDGTLAFNTDYKTETVGDFADIKNGVKNWPVPSSNNITTVDDLWHAAVNGDGTYFSAKKPNELVQKLKDAIASIKVEFGSGAAAAATTLNPIPGSTNFFYITSYNTGTWTGNLEKRTLNLLTKTINPTATACVEDVVPTANCNAPSSVQPDGAGYSCVTPSVTDPTLCAGTLVGTDCKVSVATSCTGVLKSQAVRNIYMNNGGALQPFDYSNLTAAQQTTFDSPFLLANLTQGAGYTPAQQGNLTGDKLVDYLKGTKAFDEGATNPDERLFRKRQAVLGDLVNTEPVFVGPPVFNYGDSGYAAFKATQAGRNNAIFVGSNDGMLHAFDEASLNELWAYVPTMVIPNMWKLADSNYAAKHAFYVNGDITVGDICVAADCTNATASDWRTILIGSLAAGGRGYFALDITNPSSPNLLWEFDASAANGDVNLGYSFGKPLLTKRPSDGKWVVLFSSGYNNIPDNDAFYSLPSTKFKPNNPAQFTGGDGVGRMFIVDAASGSKLADISTGVGNTTTPSGLGQLAEITPRRSVDNTATYVYGGDLLGNVWRFNLATNAVAKFAELIGPNGAQPITTKPNLGAIDANKRIILVGTGKYLEVSDLTNTNQQTLYGITDTDSTISTLVNPRSGGTLVQQTLIQSLTNPDERFISNNAVDLSSSRGWYVDFLSSGERQDVNATLVGSNLVTPTTVTESSSCQPGGFSWLYQFNFKTGAQVIPGAPVGDIYNSRINGNAVLTIDGKQYNFPSTTKGQGNGVELQQDGAGSGFQLKRSIWREIIQ